MVINRSVTRRLALTVTAGAGALASLTACGSTDDVTAGLVAVTGTAATSPSRQPGASFNEADVMFARMMIKHHEQAVKMAEPAETRAGNPEVKDLAARIKAAQESEIATMTGWLSKWGKSERPSGGEGHGVSPMPSEGMGDHGMPGMMTDEDMKRLQAAKGAEFDHMFLRMMIAHHKGAIEMSKMERARGADPQAKELARTIETTQQAEIKKMRELLDRL